MPTENALRTLQRELTPAELANHAERQHTHEPEASGTIPAELRPWAHIICAALIDAESGIRRAVRSSNTEELRSMAQEIPRYQRLGSLVLRTLSLPEPQGRGFWEEAVMPLIRDEITRRQRPPQLKRRDRIERLKSRLMLEDVAAKYTDLRVSGLGRLKGLCPIHNEQEPSFYVYLDQQRWRCFGCARGGDLIDLMEGIES